MHSRGGSTLGGVREVWRAEDAKKAGVRERKGRKFTAAEEETVPTAAKPLPASHEIRVRIDAMKAWLDEVEFGERQRVLSKPRRSEPETVNPRCVADEKAKAKKKRVKSSSKRVSEPRLPRATERSDLYVVSFLDGSSFSSTVELCDFNTMVAQTLTDTQLLSIRQGVFFHDEGRFADLLYADGLAAELTVLEGTSNERNRAKVEAVKRFNERALTAFNMLLNTDRKLSEELQREGVKARAQVVPVAVSLE